jgi:hypothetical protein
MFITDLTSCELYTYRDALNSHSNYQWRQQCKCIQVIQAYNIYIHAKYNIVGITTHSIPINTTFSVKKAHYLNKFQTNCMMLNTWRKTASLMK